MRKARISMSKQFICILTFSPVIRWWFIEIIWYFDRYIVESETGGRSTSPPFKPDFEYSTSIINGFSLAVSVIWLPCGKQHVCKPNKARAGSHFYVKYRYNSGNLCDSDFPLLFHCALNRGGCAEPSKLIAFATQSDTSSENNIGILQKS